MQIPGGHFKTGLEYPKWLIFFNLGMVKLFVFLFIVITSYDFSLCYNGNGSKIFVCLKPLYAQIGPISVTVPEEFSDIIPIFLRIEISKNPFMKNGRWFETGPMWSIHSLVVHEKCNGTLPLPLNYEFDHMIWRISFYEDENSIQFDDIILQVKNSNQIGTLSVNGIHTCFGITISFENISDTVLYRVLMEKYLNYTKSNFSIPTILSDSGCVVFIVFIMSLKLARQNPIYDVL
ncbi:hypothetical protein MXB_2678 [Myxobolus squamalis]|nr:hypothetical protein MXB_2678 [Myxobolus squamalis]